jgi:hypothetical protein
VLVQNIVENTCNLGFSVVFFSCCCDIQSSTFFLQLNRALANVSLKLFHKVCYETQPESWLRIMGTKRVWIFLLGSSLLEEFRIDA